MLLTNGIEYRCSSCGQRLTEDARSCPICKSIFVASSVIVSKGDVLSRNKEYLNTVKEACRKIDDKARKI